MNDIVSVLADTGLPSAPPRDSPVSDCDVSRQPSAPIDIPGRSRSRSPNYIVNCANSDSDASVKFLCCRRTKPATSKRVKCCSDSSFEISDNSLLDRIRCGAASDYLVTPSDFSISPYSGSPYSPTDGIECLCRELAGRVRIRQQRGNRNRSAPPSHPLRLSAVETVGVSTREAASQTEPVWSSPRGPLAAVGSDTAAPHARPSRS